MKRRKSEAYYKGALAARSARAALGIDLLSPLQDALRSIEQAGRVNVALLKLDESISGFYATDQSKPFICINLNQLQQRQRFTLAHEYGHHWLNHGSSIDYTEKARADTSAVDLEKQANCFAAEFLLPKPAVEAWMFARHEPDVDLEVVVRLGADFGVSSSAAMVQLDRVGYISSKNLKQLELAFRENRHFHLYAELGLHDLRDEIASVNESDPLYERLPEQMQLRIYRGLLQKKVEPKQAAALLRIPEEELNNRLRSRFPQ